MTAECSNSIAKLKILCYNYYKYNCFQKFKTREKEEH